MSAISQQQQPQNKIKRHFGEGTYGIIIGCPRLPSKSETRQDILNSSTANCQVSKVIKDCDDIKKINAIINLILQRFNPTNLAQLQTQIVIPSHPQIINWSEIAISPEEIAFLKSHKITKRRYKWQYLMERGTNDLDVELRNVGTLNQLKHFLKGFANIIDGVAAIHVAGLVHTDIKLTNMIVSLDGRYKLIDLDEIGDATTFPSNKSYFEKIYNNPYYPYYSPAGVYLAAFGRIPKWEWNDKFIKQIHQDFIKANYDKDYHQYFNEISQNTLQIADDFELNKIIQGPYENDQAMITYLTDFKSRIEAHYKKQDAYSELLLFIDRYAIGINLLILLNKYYRITGQINTNKPITDNNLPRCEFIPQNLIAIIKLCCSPANYSAITTQQIAEEYRGFISKLFRQYPFKFIIKLLSGFSIRRRSSQT